MNYENQLKINQILNYKLEKKMAIQISRTNSMFKDEIRKKNKTKKNSPHSLSMNNEGCESYPPFVFSI